MIEQLIAAGSRFQNMNRRINPFFHESPIQVQLHVAGSFEFLENDIVHPALGFNQGRRQDRQAASFLTVSCGSEETLRLKQSLGLNAAGHDPPFAGLKRIITACQPGNAVQKDHDILPEFDQTPCPFAHQFGHLDVACRAFIECGTEYFAIQALPEVRHLFRTFVHQ